MLRYLTLISKSEIKLLKFTFIMNQISQPLFPTFILNPDLTTFENPSGPDIITYV